MDLRSNHPRSVHARLLGVAMLARTVDKACARAHGHLGEYGYPCPMDNAVLGFLEIDADDLLDAVRRDPSAASIESFVAPYVERKGEAEVARWSDGFLNYVPAAGSDSRRRLIAMRDELAPGRPDIMTWADVLDLDEKRAVPLRTPAVR